MTYNERALAAIINRTNITLATAEQEDLPCKLIERRPLVTDSLICPIAEIFKVVCSLEELLSPLLTNLTKITAFGSDFWKYVEQSMTGHESHEMLESILSSCLVNVDFHDENFVDNIIPQLVDKFFDYYNDFELYLKR